MRERETESVDDTCSEPLKDDAYVDWKKLQQPIYYHASVCLIGAYCSIMQFAIANKVPYAAIGGLLKLLQVLCPQPNLLPKTFYNVKQFFRQFNSNTILKRVCCKCSSTAIFLCAAVDV